ncbi:MAG: hypothetical protein R2742_09900 [Micropruina glycogenica]
MSAAVHRRPRRGVSRPALRALFRALGWRELVVAYTGYGSHDFVRVMARVVLAPQWSRSQLGRATKVRPAARLAQLRHHPAYGCRSRSPWATGR